MDIKLKNSRPVFGRLLPWCINGHFTMFYLYTGAAWGGWGVVILVRNGDKGEGVLPYDDIAVLN